MCAVRIGTDCSGIEAPIQALTQLGVDFVHSFSCEKDQYARQSILANYNPEVIYEDILSRKNSQLPDIDIYVCGFPCQPFSSIGLKRGSKDKRSNIMMECIDVIKQKQPKIFILENVKNFVNIEKGKVFNFLLQQLQSERNYHVNYKILNTKDYGIPHNRERIYIVGIRKDVLTADFTWPKKFGKLRRFENFLIDKQVQNIKPNNNAQQIIKTIANPQKNHIIASAGFGNYMTDITPSITCNTYYYLTKYKRYMYPTECLLLQGFSKSFKQVVSNRQLYKQAGNTMSVNVLKQLFKQLFKATNVFN